MQGILPSGTVALSEPLDPSGSLAEDDKLNLVLEGCMGSSGTWMRCIFSFVGIFLPKAKNQKYVPGNAGGMAVTMPSVVTRVFLDEHRPQWRNIVLSTANAALKIVWLLM